MLYTVQFLCSVVATFVRHARVLRKAMASVLCSPVSVPAASPTAGLTTPLSSRRKAHSVVAAAFGDALHGQRVVKGLEQLVVAPPAVVLAACDGGNGSVDQAETKKKGAWAARRRPSKLLIPAVPDTGEATFGEAVAVKEKEAVVEVEGEGFWLASRRGARHAMEDGYGVTTDKNINAGDSQLAFYGVYDGHGGRAAVDLVSGRLGKNVLAAVLAATGTREAEEASSSVDAVEAAIRAAYLATDSDFLSQGARGGACAATALVKDGDLYVANLGDCRAVMSHNGAATALTSDHTAAREDERARIESSGGYVSCGSNGVWRVQDCLAVSRAFGDGSLKRWVISEPEIRRLPLTAGCEFLVIASDGLWNKVSNQEAVDAVSRSNPSNSMVCCKELVDMARGRGSRDDITVMVVDLKRFVQ